MVYPRADAIEEVSVTSAASGAESLGEGAIQVKFVTKSGTNNWHGGAFWQERNTFFNANTYFNNIDGLNRDRILLHQVGAHIGGPIINNKLFIFFNYEIFRFPQSWNEAQDKGAQLTVLTDSARNGLFTYKDSGGLVRQVNLYNVAGAAGYRATPDPIMANTLSLIAQSTAGGALASRVTSNDYNRNNFNFLAAGSHKIDFPTGKLDYVINSKHHFEATGGVNPYRLFPDGINAVIPVFPGSGTVLGSKANAGQREAFWTGSTAVRSAWSSTWTSEVRFGISSGNILFFNDISPDLFAPWNGYAPNMAGYVTVPYNASTYSRRNDPVKQFSGSASWVHGSHLINMGGSYSRINEWQASYSTQVIPRVSFGVQNTDPIIGQFTSANFPGASSSDLANAEALYALLTGRVSAITRSVVLSDQTHTYGANGTVARWRQQEFGMYVQDSWKATKRLTVNFGLRLENQNPFHSLNGTYTRPGYAGLFGVSGVGNLFQARHNRRNHSDIDSSHQRHDRLLRYALLLAHRGSCLCAAEAGWHSGPRCRTQRFRAAGGLRDRFRTRAVHRAVGQQSGRQHQHQRRSNLIQHRSLWTGRRHPVQQQRVALRVRRQPRQLTRWLCCPATPSTITIRI